MKATPDIGRRNAIPIIYTSGTYYEVGFDVVSPNPFYTSKSTSLNLEVLN